MAEIEPHYASRDRPQIAPESHMKPKDVEVYFQKWKLSSTIIQDSKDGDYATGFCPECGDVQKSDVERLTHEQTMKLNIQKIITHLTMVHGELFDPPIAKDPVSEGMRKIKKEIWGDINEN